MELGQSVVGTGGAEVGGAFSLGPIKVPVCQWTSAMVGQPGVSTGNHFQVSALLQM